MDSEYHVISATQVQISLELFLGIDKKSTLVQVMAWRRAAIKPLPKQCWPRSLTSYSFPRTQWANMAMPSNQHSRQADRATEMSYFQYLFDTVYVEGSQYDSPNVFRNPKAVDVTSSTSLTIVYWTVYSGTDQRKHQSSASLAFVRGIHRWPVNSPHKGPVTRKLFPFDEVIMEIWPLYLACSYLHNATGHKRIKYAPLSEP